jgi:murein L,D-transpeptidase YafK
MPIAPSETSFAREQLRHPRVRNARDATQTRIEQMFEEKNIGYPAAEMYIRIYKWDKTLELWVRSADSKKFELLKTYEVCAMSGIVGPKSRRGDKQVPEGFYSVDVFNPVSSYHLSLGVDYPNERDAAANKGVKNLGGDIFIHGGCRSDGCIAVTDDGINELYWLAVETRGMGQQNIPVHIFPGRLDDENEMKKLERLYQKKPSVIAFWQTLKPGYMHFQKKRQLPYIVVEDGNYRVADAPTGGERARGGSQ